MAQLFSLVPLVAPAVAAVTAMMLSFSPTYRRTGPILVLGTTISLAVIAPWFLELGGVLSHTIQLTLAASRSMRRDFGEVPKIAM